MTPSTHATPRLPAISLLMLLVAAQWLLVSNPGYFSHDELQWGARAEVASLLDLPWVPWTNVTAFQWRPLTFNTWMVLSHGLFDSPMKMHLAWVVAGSAIAVGLAGLLMRLGAGRAVAVAAALVFALGPYAAYVHGWVATLADLLWVGASVALGHALLSLDRRKAHPLAFAAVAFAFTAAGLLAKEAAVSMPALLGLAWLLHRDGPVRFAAVVGSGLATVVYLALRLSTLMAPGEGSGYSISPLSAPGNWGLYWLFPLTPGAFEAGNTLLASRNQLVVAGLAVFALLALVARHSPRHALALVAGSALALAPALPLPFVANQYGYGFWAWTVACFALAWPRLGRPARALVLVLAAVSVWSGWSVQTSVARVGERQAVFQPALVEALARHEGELRLWPATDAWVFLRLTTAVPSWRGQPIGERVRIVGTPEEAHYEITADGALRPLP